jgi:type II secretory pathway component PulC
MLLTPLPATILGCLVFYEAAKVRSTNTRDLSPGQEMPMSVQPWPASLSLESAEWGVFAPRPSKSNRGSEDGLAKRFRLAGTFFSYGSDGSSRRAILDDLDQSQQHIISENESIGLISVLHIYADRIVLRDAGGRTEQLWLSFSARNEATSAAAGLPGVSEDAGAVVGEAERSPYGITRVGEKRWVSSRESLMEYYAKLRSDPQRLLAIFDSFKPLYNGSGRIEGYRIDMQGEADFLRAAGLQNGDIVRAVNSIKMSSRNRAEYLIKEFVANRANAFVFEVEREDASEKFIYQIR